MRYDKPIYFQKLAPDRYDPETGDYVENGATEIEKFADVTDAGINMLQIIYGSIKEGAIVVKIQQPFVKAFDYIRVDEKRYKADFIRGGRVFVCHEVVTANG